MKEVNAYFKGSSGKEKKINKIKYEILNDYGYDFSSSLIEKYNEEEIIKSTCDLKNEMFSLKD